MTMLIALALQAATVPCAPGIYVATEGAAPQALVETRASHRKVAGLPGMVLLGPFGKKMKVKSVVPGAQAAIRVKPGRPVFEFCFAPPAAAASGSDYVGVGAPASTPGEYYLVRFDAGSNQRELALSTIGSFSGPKGVLSESVTPFRAEQIEPGRFRVTPARDLPAGEYGFMQPPARTGSARGKDATERVFDFSVRE